MKTIQRFAQKLSKCNELIIGAGAGIGKDSGLPDFRGNQGFWNNYPPYRGKFDFYACANPQFLRDNPHLFWGFYGSRLVMYRDKVPHEGFKIIKNIGEKLNNNYFIVTSNVDGHFHRIFPAEKIH